MGAKTNIAWTDSTWNPVIGCSRVSPGCEHCYAEKLSCTRLRHLPAYAAVTKDGGWNGQTRCMPERLDQPLRWRKPRKIFVCDMGDLFHDTVPFEFVAAVFGVMAACPRHTFQILTKRPQRMLEFFGWLSERAPRCPEGCTITCINSASYHVDFMMPRPMPLFPLPNVHLGVTCEDQQRANERIPLLLKCPAAVRFVSAEPLLEAIDFQRDDYGHESGGPQGWVWDRWVDWIIVGGESGPKARPCDVEWIRSIRDQCSAAGTACFVKQMGSSPINTWGNDPPWELRNRHGADPTEWPADLRVREYPTT